MTVLCFFVPNGLWAQAGTNSEPRQEPQSTQQQQQPGQQQPLPEAPPNNNTQTPPANQQPSLEELGMSPAGSAQEQALLDKRSYMLKMHQRLGLITAIPLVATLFSGGLAQEKKGMPASNTGLDLHAALGGVTVGLYGATAYYAMFAPRPEGTKTRGPIRFHEAMAWIHGPGIVLTSVLGVLAYDQQQNGEKVHGIASAHAPVAYVTAAAYGAGIISASWPIHWKFWEK